MENSDDARLLPVAQKRVSFITRHFHPYHCGQDLDPHPLTRSYSSSHYSIDSAAGSAPSAVKQPFRTGPDIGVHRNGVHQSSDTNGKDMVKAGETIYLHVQECLHARECMSEVPETKSWKFEESDGGNQIAGERKIRKVIVVVGAGDATGGAVAKRFAREGYIACVVRRNRDKLLPLVEEIRHAGGEAFAFGVDARKEDEMVELMGNIERDVGEIRVTVFNIGANVKFGILDTTSRVYFKVWEMACFAGFLTGREAAKHMIARNAGTIIFTGATASVRGGSGFAAFSGAKFALRSLAQSMARELGPRGLHVAHVVIDGPINTTWTLSNIKDSAMLAEKEGLVQPDDVAEIYWQLHLQPKGAWSHELDLRPWVEPW